MSQDGKEADRALIRERPAALPHLGGVMPAVTAGMDVPRDGSAAGR